MYVTASSLAEIVTDYKYKAYQIKMMQKEDLILTIERAGKARHRN